jgi:hypothetical protein
MNEGTQRSTMERKGPSSMTRKPIRCDAQQCGHPAMSTLELHFFCVDHFISYSYERLNRCRPIPFNDPDEQSTEANHRFLQQCSDQAANLLRPMLGLDNLDRARLFDILLWASELTTLRRALKPDEMARR